MPRWHAAPVLSLLLLTLGGMARALLLQHKVPRGVQPA